VYQYEVECDVTETATVSIITDLSEDQSEILVKGTGRYLGEYNKANKQKQLRGP
jgi:hypothetical protein